MRISNEHAEVKAVYEKLNENRWYWEMDNEYKHKFWIVEDGAKNWERISRESKPYVLDMARFMEEANKRIFKA
jgi:hypothetical protein